MLERILPGASQLQNYHPLLVHFPIAFIYGAALLYFLASIAASERLKWTALWMLMLGALGAAAAVASGFYAATGLMVSQSVRHELLRNHKHLMVAASAVTGVLTVWAIATRPMPTRGRYLFLVGLDSTARPDSSRRRPGRRDGLQLQRRRLRLRATDRFPEVVFSKLAHPRQGVNYSACQRRP